MLKRKTDEEEKEHARAQKAGALPPLGEAARNGLQRQVAAHVAWRRHF